tara:strand:+ start:442 stop:666 length:225 start_codon:yes stop_codon:yes gene_type:complete
MWGTLWSTRLLGLGKARLMPAGLYMVVMWVSCLGGVMAAVSSWHWTLATSTCLAINLRGKETLYQPWLRLTGVL